MLASMINSRPSGNLLVPGGRGSPGRSPGQEVFINLFQRELCSLGNHQEHQDYHDKSNAY